MTNRDIMLRALKLHVLPQLREQGFDGKYPNFKRTQPNCIELIGFQANKWGGSFLVEMSAAFPNSKPQNFQLYGDMTLDTLRIDATNRRYRLPGMFDGWFPYCDVYKERVLLGKSWYHFVSPSEKSTFDPGKKYTLVQRFDEQAAFAICQEVNKQLTQGFTWLQAFEQKHI